MSKAQHSTTYRFIPQMLKRLREEAGMTQRQLGRKLRKPQSWIYNCETANRRVDVSELVLWCRACKIDPHKALRQVIKRLR